MKLFSKGKKRQNDQSKNGEVNPYLDARRTWNSHNRSMLSSIQTWQMAGVLSLLIGLAGVGGVIYIGSQSKFVPYIVEVDKHGGTASRGIVDSASPLDPRIMQASISEFIQHSRTVTPDVSLQRQAIFDVYSMLLAGDPAIAKMNEWLNGSKESNPFVRAKNVMVHVDKINVLQQSSQSWQVDWTETTRDRQGELLKRTDWRALVTVYQSDTTSDTTTKEMQENPLGIFVRDFSWSQLPN